MIEHFQHLSPFEHFSHLIMNGSIVSHYRIIKKIGSGGMGDVYLAEDTKLDRVVALKILPRDLASQKERMARFVQEARAASSLDHPNLATVYEIGDTDGTRFIAMQYVEGETLSEKLRKGPIPVQGSDRYCDPDCGRFERGPFERSCSSRFKTVQHYDYSARTGQNTGFRTCKICRI